MNKIMSSVPQQASSKNERQKEIFHNRGQNTKKWSLLVEEEEGKRKRNP